MTFNPDLRQQTKEVLFSCKSRKPRHQPLVFNNNNVSQIFSQKYLGVILDSKLRFENLLNNVLAKFNKIVGFLGKLRNLPPTTMLITSYRTFI